jgi:hypothetical protein
MASSKGRFLRCPAYRNNGSYRGKSQLPSFNPIKNAAPLDGAASVIAERSSVGFHAELSRFFHREVSHL